jgi:FkbM family methyltransferase
MAHAAANPSFISRTRGQIVGLARRLGYDVARLRPPTEARRMRASLIAELQIDVAIDGGANTGEFARELRLDGYRGRIISFEPGGNAFQRLREHSAGDPDWDCVRVALGASDGTVMFNIAANSSSSSVLGMTSVHEQSAPGSDYIGVEAVKLARLDSLRHSLRLNDARMFIKVDVQGYELEVLRGAELALRDTIALESELSFVELYEGQPLFADVVLWLREAGFVLSGIEAVHFDVRTGELLQVNGLFRRPVCGCRTTARA